MYQSDMYNEKRPNVGVTVVPFIFENDEFKVLVYNRGENAEVFKNHYALPNCFFDITEMNNLDVATHKALKTKTSVDFPYIEQLHTFGGDYIDPDRMTTVNITYFALAQRENITEFKDPKFDTEWISYDRLMKKDLAFNHKEVLEMAMERLKSKAEYTNLPSYLLNKEFTISELRRVTEKLIGEKLDNSRYRDRIKKSGVIKPIEGKTKMTGANRPAQIYTINTDYKGCFYPKSLTKPKYSINKP